MVPLVHPQLLAFPLRRTDWDEVGFEPPTLWSLGHPLYHLSHSHHSPPNVLIIEVGKRKWSAKYPVSPGILRQKVKLLKSFYI